MQATRLPSIISNPNTPIRCSVIWLHGLGASNNDFAPLVPELGIQDDLGIRFVFPQAPDMPVSINNGMVMPAWYDISVMDLMKRADADGIATSSNIITDMINDEIAMGIDPSNIVIAGFSQGGVIAIDAGIRFPNTLAGIMALSTYIPMRDTLPNASQSGNGSIPIFYGHGDFDPVIPIEQAESARTFLEENGYSVKWHTYPMEHSVSPKEIDHIKTWLTKVFS
ncbi:MAG: carboxylesterase [Piscirickettsiaceae bacterium]|nr:MAG: carboxylesterase [Piscirickettsiaceae bacterium]PCI72461.1 MAG: carboxylesterase [Piscirickettsiaceae bacterium]